MSDNDIDEGMEEGNWESNRGRERAEMGKVEEGTTIGYIAIIKFKVPKVRAINLVRYAKLATTPTMLLCNNFPGTGIIHFLLRYLARCEYRPNSQSWLRSLLYRVLMHPR